MFVCLVRTPNFECIDFERSFGVHVQVGIFSKAYLIESNSKLALSDRAINWIISYLTGRTQVVNS